MQIFMNYPFSAKIFVGSGELERVFSAILI